MDLLQYAQETPTGFICRFCLIEYHGSFERFKWHLAKIEGHDIDICPLIDEADCERVRKGYCCPSRKRTCISTDLPSRKRARNVVANVTTLGLHLLAAKVVDKQFHKCIEDIWSCLMNDDHVFRIGIHGIGGVGKTEVAKFINNKLLQTPNKFHHVFWVNVSPRRSISKWPTVSPSRTVRDLQSSISKAVGVDLSNGDDEIKRAAQLSKGLAEKKKSFFILDDVWDYISLHQVGIPVGVDLCTVLFTTRSLQVCRQFGCQRQIEIRCLLPDESYELFKENLGEETPLSRDVEEVSRLVADKCAGLPLAITITARNMKGVSDIRQWRSALRGDTRKKIDMEIFQKLKLSYDYLKDATLQHCFLYCPLFVRGGKYCVQRKMLAEFLLDEGIIERTNRRREELDEANAKLNFLGDVGLLEIYEHEFVKMNEVIRRMALQIMEENNQRSMIKVFESLKDLPDKESWTGDLVRVSLRSNQIKRIPRGYSPSCYKLSTLLLGVNLRLGYIGQSFFKGMPGLKVLDLSYTGILSLPSSIYCLVNLTTLLLSYCSKLREFPKVAKLGALKKLDLSFSPVKGVVKAIQIPGKLTYLDLFGTGVEFELQILAKLAHLQFLRLPQNFLSRMPLESAVKTKVLSCLRRLETLVCSIYDVVELKEYLVQFKEREPPTVLDLKVGEGAINYDGFESHLIYDDGFTGGRDEDLRAVVLYNCNINEADMLIYFHQIAIVKCQEARSLCNFSPIKGATQLNYFSIRDCDGLEMLCSLSLTGQGILEHLEYMELSNLKKLGVLFSKEGNGNVAYGSCFSNLTRFFMHGCPSIKQLFPIKLLPNLKNLQRLYVLDCLSLEEIFAAEEEEEEETGMAELEKNVCLSRLCIVVLKDLPELKRVCGGRLNCVIPGSCSPVYANCPKLMLDGDDNGCQYSGQWK